VQEITVLRKGEKSMRLRVSEILSLDAVMETPDRWVGSYMDQEIGQDVMSILGETDAMLFGRKTYQEMAAAWPNRTGGMADIFNSVPKYVVSSTLRDVTWNNSHVITGNVVEEVARLKAQPGGTLLVNGSADLVRLLTQHHLIDEYILTVAPLVLLKGKRLFQAGMEGQLQLLNSRAYKTGIVRLNYQPVKQ
jgi:dihydrofolate reductase